MEQQWTEEEIETLKQQAREQRDAIISHPEKKTFKDADGAFTVSTPDGRGVAYNADGTFRGFTDSQQFLSGDFRIQLCRDTDCGWLVADIHWSNHRVAIVNRDRGVYNFEIVIFKRPGEIDGWTFRLDSFRNAIQTARTLLLSTERR